MRSGPSVAPESLLFSKHRFDIRVAQTGHDVGFYSALASVAIPKVVSSRPHGAAPEALHISGFTVPLVSVALPKVRPRPHDAAPEALRSAL